MKYHTITLTPREYRRIKRLRGKQQCRQVLYGKPLTQLARYWWDWDDIRGEWPFLRGGGWQQESVRRAYRLRLQRMRAVRLSAFA